MRCACIDIGSNTTRILVADVEGGRLVPVHQERAFTRIGRSLGEEGAIPAAKRDEVVAVVAAQAAAATQHGASALRVVATAAIRAAANGAELCRAIEERAGARADVLEGREEASLAFAGATHGLAGAPDALVGVADVGGGSSEIAVGTPGEGVRWSHSFLVGSGLLTDAYLRSDPPEGDELRVARLHAAGVFDGLGVPRPSLAVAVGGSATSLWRLVGAVLEPVSLQRALAVLSSAPCEVVARRHGLDPERVRLLPAGICILDAVSRTLGQPLRIGAGGLREGVCLALAASAGPASRR